MGRLNLSIFFSRLLLTSQEVIMYNRVSLHALITGRVQGVFFRAFVLEKAQQLDLTGYVHNMPSVQNVEVVAEGEHSKLEKLVEYLKTGPPESRVDKIDLTWGKFSARYSSFIVRS